MGFMTASSVYDCSNGTTYVRLRLHHPGFYHFSTEVSRLRRLCEAEGALADVYVDRFVRTVERYRYQVSAAPVSFARVLFGSTGDLDALEEDAEIIGIGRSELRVISQGIVADLKGLVAEDAAPYLECAACSACKPLVGREAMVVCPTNLLSAARDTIDELIGPGSLPLLAPSELKRGCTYDRLLLAGPFSWFARRAAHVLVAPRAREIVSVSYDWLPDQWQRESDFVHSETCPAYLPGPPRSVACTIMNSAVTVQVLDETVLPSSAALFQDVAPLAARGEGSFESRSDPVPTRGFLLEPSCLLLVEDDPDNRMLVLDFSRDVGRQLVKMPISDIEPGTFVLHRSAGSGDYVVDLANKILGVRRDYLRGRQGLWKSRLRLRADVEGYERVAGELIANGSAIANYQNVRNWLSARNIMTNDRSDFGAIMRLVGLEDQADSLWREMKEIRTAHLKAGGQIKRMLLRQVSHADAAELLRLGYWDFDLGEDDGGVLTAQRVLEIAQGTPALPEDLLPLYREI